MRRTLAVVLLALSALIGLPGGAEAKGDSPAVVVVTNSRTGDVVALRFSSTAYADLARALASDPLVTSGPPPRGLRGAAVHQLVWLSQMSEVWRRDTLFVDRDGTATVTTMMARDLPVPIMAIPDPAPRAVRSGELAEILDGLSSGPPPASPVRQPAVDPAPSPDPATGPSTSATTRWFSLAGWRWAVPGLLGGLLVGLVAARRRVPAEPRRTLVDLPVERAGA